MYAGARVLLGPRARMRPMDGPISFGSRPPRLRELRGLAAAGAGAEEHA